MKKSFGFLTYIVPALAVTGVLVFGGLALKDQHAYREARDAEAVLESLYIHTEETTAVPESSTAAAEAGSAPAETIEEDNTYYPSLDIDYAGLTEINPDFCCVLSIPCLELQYPVPYSHDNKDYLHLTFDGRKNSAGSVFYDYYSMPDFAAKNTFLFGHNMKDGSVFGSLKRFYKEQGVADADPYIYVFMPDRAQKYQIFSYYRTEDGSPTYADFEGDEGYSAYVDRCLSLNMFTGTDTSLDFSAAPPLLTLSTCAGASGGKERFVVHAVLIHERRTP